jgi:signal transduction histidine kinase
MPWSRPQRTQQWVIFLTAVTVIVVSTVSGLTLRKWEQDATRTMLTVLKMHYMPDHLDNYYAQGLSEGQLSPQLKTQLARKMQESQVLLKELPTTKLQAESSQKIGNHFRQYLQVSSQKFEYLAAGDLKRAEAWEKTQVQPQNQVLHSVLNQVVSDSEQIIQRTYLKTTIGSGFVFVAGAMAIAVLVRRSINAQHKMQIALAEQTILKEKEIALRQERELLENRVEARTQALRNKNKSLAQTIQHLKIAQHELVQSEKMSALGRLIAGVAHEINTPLGAINASAGNTSTALQEVLIDLPIFCEMLTQEEQQCFYDVLHCALKAKPFLTSSERRPLRKALAQLLQQHHIDNAKGMAERLLDIGLYEGVEQYIPFLRGENVDWSLHLLYNLTRLQNNSRNIQIAVDRASKTVFALKNYAHFDHSGQKTCVVLTEGIETVLELYQNQIKRGIQIHREYDLSSSVWCYPDELIQVWTNLIHNAIQAMSEQGSLTIQVRQDQQKALVRIIDTGSGITPEIAEKIFQPFFTTKPIGEGSGLGLSICKQIIDKHVGEIEVQSKPGETVFSVWLPLEATDSTRLESRPVAAIQGTRLDKKLDSLEQEYTAALG